MVGVTLAGCNGTAGPLRGVGAPDRVHAVDSQLASEPGVEATDDAVVRAARVEQLQSGTPLNVAPQESAYAPPSQVPPPPQMATTREEAVEQIRAKATEPSELPPGVFAETRAATRQINRAELDRLSAQMREAASRNDETLTAADAEKRAARARNLRYRAGSHYEDAVKQIEQ